MGLNEFTVGEISMGVDLYVVRTDRCLLPYLKFPHTCNANKMGVPEETSTFDIKFSCDFGDPASLWMNK